jgi:cephalosporin hydroxylase
MVPSSLKERFEQLCTEPSDVQLHLPTFVGVADHLKAQHVIELGTRTGVSTIAWLYAMERTGGHLTSVDVDPRPDIGEFPQWTFHQANDLDPALLGELSVADIVFIDTSHDYDQTLAELNVYQHLLRHGGVFLLHDTELEHPEGAPAYPIYPVKKAVQRFVAEQGYRWINEPKCFGLATIKVE